MGWVPLPRKTTGYIQSIGDHSFLIFPGEVNSRVLEKQVQLLVEPQNQEEQCSFCPSGGTLDNFYPLTKVLDRALEFATPVKLFYVDLEKVR